MRVRTFKPQFAPLVKSGAKRQTIRPMPKRLPRAGDKESWREWSGLPYRSPQREPATVQLISVDCIWISYGFIIVKDRALSPRAAKSLARRDGFADLLPMLDWFKSTHGLPFTGILIRAK